MIPNRRSSAERVTIGSICMLQARGTPQAKVSFQPLSESSILSTIPCHCDDLALLAIVSDELINQSRSLAKAATVAEQDWHYLHLIWVALDDDVIPPFANATIAKLHSLW